VLFSGEIKSVDWENKTAVTYIIPDGESHWDELFQADSSNALVSLFNLISNTEKVSSKSYEELTLMLKENY
jgi:hypothetical protein